MIIMIGCSKQTQVIGIYKSESPKKIEKIWRYYTQGVYSYLTGYQLTLKKDSIFDLINCSTISSGKWYSENDSIYLIYETAFKSMDMKGNGQKCPRNPLQLKLEKRGCCGK